MKTIHQNSVYHCATPAQVQFMFCSVALSAAHNCIIGVRIIFFLLAQKCNIKCFRNVAQRCIMELRMSPLHPEFEQEAVARGFEREYEVFGTPESYFQQLPAMLCHKKDKLAPLLESVGLKPIMPEGGYFMTADFSSISERRTKIYVHHSTTWWV